MKKDSDILTFINILKEFVYTSDGNRETARRKSIGNQVFKRIARIEAQDPEKFDDSQGKRMKIILPFNNFDICTKLKVL